ncbi:pre-rRNA-processing protein TSR1 homolog [Watersipora subatra]|uniref:pre-rRNA-processing protein TSR1 homolog n=1 Tax=Watersipora subatra TaxID=2589382 RepID=UPI00355B7BED
METHRPGPLKQQNKTHNSGRHRSKGQLKRTQKGKTAVVQGARRKKSQLSRVNRRNQANQLRKSKREELQLKKRGIGGERSPPHYVAVISLSSSCAAEDLLKVLLGNEEDSVSKTGSQGVIHVSYSRLKQRVAYVLPDLSNLAAVLESVRVCDTALFLWSLQDSIDDAGEKLYSCIFAQGLPSTAHAVMGVKGIPVKKQTEVKKLLNKDIEARFTGSKVHICDSASDAQLLLRFITQQKLKVIKSREMRPHILAEQLDFVPNDDDQTSGTLKVTGYLRGPPLSVNRLVHIPGYGDYQINRILAPTDPYPLVLAPEQRKRNNDVDMESVGPALLAQCDSRRQESLASVIDVDPMEGEQTWPTEEELAESVANAAVEKTKTVVRVPKGTSSYQATWIVDAPVVSDESDTEDESENSMDEEGDEEEMEDSDCADFDDTETDSVAPSVTWAEDVKYDQQMDLDQEELAKEIYRQQREHEQFPDEVDTPENKPARLRFARYRGLKSFRTSPWDPKENLPIDYSRIFQFQNFSRYLKNVCKEELSDGIVPGWYITVEVKNVAREVYDRHVGKQGVPLTLVGLLLSEQKMSVLHFTVRRHSLYTEPVKSKERLIIQCGFRRFECNPIFSDHSNLDKHKYERFLPQTGICTLSTYAPVTFPPAAVLVFKESAGGHDLVASGSLLSVDPDRLIIKRLVLSGHPYKINKRTAVIRYMFYNREDIEWFKVVELKTKWGRRGHIKEALGTHGHMKCVFDSQLKSQDTPLLMLYKRVFPKWTYSGYVPPTLADNHSDDGMKDIFT